MNPKKEDLRLEDTLLEISKELGFFKCAEKLPKMVNMICPGLDILRCHQNRQLGIFP